MKNTASVFNDGESVYFNSKVNLSTKVKALLIVLNFLFIGFITLILIPTEPGEKGSAAVFITLPLFYMLTLGRISLWNFFGEEQIIINTKSIIHRKNFGFFSTSFQAIQYRTLRYELVKKNESGGKPYYTINFIDKTQMDIPIVIFSSSVYVAIESLKELTNQLSFVFTIEHLSKTSDNYIQLN